jgi:hypothetical protein
MFIIMQLRVRKSPDLSSGRRYKNVMEIKFHQRERGRRGRDCMVVGFTIAYTIGAYYH